MIICLFLFFRLVPRMTKFLSVSPTNRLQYAVVWARFEKVFKYAYSSATNTRQCDYVKEGMC